MTDTIERVARAMHDSTEAERRLMSLLMGGESHKMLCCSWDDKEVALKALSLKEARAAIAAHEASLKERGLVIVPREPTEAMLNADLGRDGYSTADFLDDFRAADVYKAMITAALGEE